MCQGVRLVTVAKRFELFLTNIRLTDAQTTAGRERRANAVAPLNSHYWRSFSATDNSRYVGSWGKHTPVRPPRDVDVLFRLPPATFRRFEQRVGNRQSQILQEVRGVLGARFPNTAIRGDGPVVVVPFVSHNIELIPAFELQNGRSLVCMTDRGGWYKEADYSAEAVAIQVSNNGSGGKTRELVRMMKRWQSYCSVPIKSFWIELLAIRFLAGWQYRNKTRVYYDYMIRDFLSYMERQAHGFVYAPGTNEAMYLGDAWVSRVVTAKNRAIKACSLEVVNGAGAGDEWQKIFGADIPKYV